MYRENLKAEVLSFVVRNYIENERSYMSIICDKERA